MSTHLLTNYGGKIEVIVVKSITDKRRMQDYFKIMEVPIVTLLLLRYRFPKAAFVMHDATILSP